MAAINRNQLKPLASAMGVNLKKFNGGYVGALPSRQPAPAPTQPAAPNPQQNLLTMQPLQLQNVTNVNDPYKVINSSLPWMQRGQPQAAQTAMAGQGQQLADQGANTNAQQLRMLFANQRPQSWLDRLRLNAQIRVDDASLEAGKQGAVEAGQLANDSRRVALARLLS